LIAELDRRNRFIKEQKKQIRYWKKLQMEKKPTPGDKLEQIKLENKGKKKRWHGKRKDRKVLKSLSTKKIDWRNFFSCYCRAMQEGKWLRRQGRGAKSELLRRGQNVRLQGYEQFLLSEIYNQAVINTVARTEKVRKDIWEFIFCHKDFPIQYQFNPFEEYAKDDFEKTRCCWMILGELVNRNKAEWLEIIKLGSALQMDHKYISYDGTLFGIRFKKFVKKEMNNFINENKTIDGQTFDDKMMEKAINLYYLEDPKYTDFLDYEIYDQEDEIIKNQHLKDDVDRDIIKKQLDGR
jgi:hypothetical protein